MAEWNADRPAYESAGMQPDTSPREDRLPISSAEAVSICTDLQG